MKRPKHIVEEAVDSAVRAGVDSGLFPQEAKELRFAVDVPKKGGRGDLATNVAFLIAPLLKVKPHEASGKCFSLLRKQLEDGGMPYISSVREAPPFLNFDFSDRYFAEVLKCVYEFGPRFGRMDEGKGERVNVEFVSANPTGPLHVGHGRGAIVGDVIAAVLDACGYSVTREYYVNDQGAQIRNLGVSLRARVKEMRGEPCTIPADGYHGDYVKDLAAALIEERGDAAASLADGDYSAWGAARLLDAIKNDLAAFGVAFDVWARESDLHHRGAVKEIIGGLMARGLAFDDSTGAVMLRADASKEFGDDKDRVLVKSGGDATYFASDIAYHDDKIRRGFARLINVWGADHHGYIPRVRAGLKALGHDPRALDVILVQMVNVLRDGKPVPMSKRSGSFITLREVLDEVGRDASRIVFCMRRPDAQIDFDLDLVKRKTLDNPVFYMQYGHARLCAIARKAATQGIPASTFDAGLVQKLALPEEREIMKRMAFYPEALVDCARTREPHHLVFYVNETIGVFHAYYTKYKHTERVISDEPGKTAARLMLCAALRTVLANAMGILGVDAPESMDGAPGEED